MATSPGARALPSFSFGGLCDPLIASWGSSCARRTCPEVFIPGITGLFPSLNNTRRSIKHKRCEAHPPIARTVAPRASSPPRPFRASANLTSPVSLGLGSAGPCPSQYAPSVRKAVGGSALCRPVFEGGVVCVYQNWFPSPWTNNADHFLLNAQTSACSALTTVAVWIFNVLVPRPATAEKQKWWASTAVGWICVSGGKSIDAGQQQLRALPRSSPPPPPRGPWTITRSPFACCIGSRLSDGRCGRCPPPPRALWTTPLPAPHQKGQMGHS